MSDNPMAIHFDNQPPLAVKLRSWKWWLYGDVNSQPLPKPPSYYYPMLVSHLLLWAFLFAYPWFLTFAYRNPPELSTLQVEHGSITPNPSTATQFWMTTKDGRELPLEFPAYLFIASIGGGVEKLGPGNQKLRGCDATVWYDTPRFTVLGRHRVWQIQCRDSDVAASYEEIVAESDVDGWLLVEGVLTFLVWPLVSLVTLARAKRNLLRARGAR